LQEVELVTLVDSLALSLRLLLSGLGVRLFEEPLESCGFEASFLFSQHVSQSRVLCLSDSFLCLVRGQALQNMPEGYLVESSQVVVLRIGVIGGCLLRHIHHTGHEIIVFYRTVLQEDLLSVRTDEARDHEEASEVDSEDEFSNLLTMLEHDEFVLPVSDHKLEIAGDGRNCPIKSQLGKLHLVCDVFKTRPCLLVLLAIVAVGVPVEFVLETCLHLIFELVTLVEEVPCDPKVRLHVEITSQQLKQVLPCKVVALGVCSVEVHLAEVVDIWQRDEVPVDYRVYLSGKHLVQVADLRIKDDSEGRLIALK